MQTNPYITFNNQIRRVMLTMGEDGTELVNIFNDVEKYGTNKYITEDLKRLV